MASKHICTGPAGIGAPYGWNTEVRDTGRRSRCSFGIAGALARRDLDHTVNGYRRPLTDIAR